MGRRRVATASARGPRRARVLALVVLAVATAPLALSGAAGAAPGPTPGAVYVTNLNQNTISEIKPVTHAVTTVGGFNGPLGIAIAPERHGGLRHQLTVEHRDAGLARVRPPGRRGRR